jgi:hypothetical protein
MIWESHYWKEDLARLAVCLQKRSKQRQWSERSLAKLEKEIFLGFYSVRKLLEARKLSEREVLRIIPANSYYPSGNHRISFFNWNRKLFDAFDITKPKKTTVTTVFLCNQIIHSYAYQEKFDDHGRLTGVYVSSDRQKHKTLYFIALKEIIKVFKAVGHDYPTRLEAKYDEKLGDYVVKHW